MIHRLDQIADAGSLTTSEMTQIVNANMLHPNAFQCGSQRVSDYFIGEMATAPNGSEQQRIWLIPT